MHTEDTISALWNVYSPGTSWAWLKIAGTSPCWDRNAHGANTCSLDWVPAVRGPSVDPCRLHARAGLCEAMQLLELLYPFTRVGWRPRAALNQKDDVILRLNVIQRKSNAKLYIFFSCFGVPAWDTPNSKVNMCVQTCRRWREKNVIFCFLPKTMRLIQVKNIGLGMAAGRETRLSSDKHS